MPSSDTRLLAEALIARRSVTPEDAGCIDLIRERLAPLGFQSEVIDSGPADGVVRNLWSKRPATGSSQAQAAIKTIVFAGHTDVVPTGPLEQWTSDPFSPTERDGKLYGRGASDMKTSIAAFVVAVEELIVAQPNAPLHIALLLTSDEEGPAVDGTVVVCNALRHRGEQLDFYRRRAHQRPPDRRHDQERPARHAFGQTQRQGHPGPHRLPAAGAQPDPPAGACAGRAGGHRMGPRQRSVLSAHQLAVPATSTAVPGRFSNIIPGSVVVDFNFRFCTESTPESLRARVEEVLRNRHGLDYELQWTLGGLRS